MASVLRATAPHKGRGKAGCVEAPSSRVVIPCPKMQCIQLHQVVSFRDTQVRCVAADDQVSGAAMFVDAGTDIMETSQYMDSMPEEPVAGAYAFYDEARVLQFVGISQNIRFQFEEHMRVVPQQLRVHVRVRALISVELATQDAMLAQAQVWIDEAGGELPPGNSDESSLWAPPESDPPAAEGGADADRPVVVSPFSRATVHREVGEAAVAEGEREMTVQSVDKALNDIRQYLFADGGDISVLRVEGGKVFVQFEGACASCSSQETTMTMGVQRALAAAFGSQLEEVVPVEKEGPVAPGGEGRLMTVAEVDSLLALLRPAVANYGGTMEVVSVEGSQCTVRYKGPDAIWTGVKMAIHDKFGDEVDDVIRVDVEEVSAGGESVAVPQVE